eukprot:1158506-Pelagomonas_calceolata.AAC.2
MGFNSSIRFAPQILSPDAVLKRLQKRVCAVCSSGASARPHHILKGGFTVAADLVRSLDPVPKGVIVEFVAASSYGAGTETSGTVKDTGHVGCTGTVEVLLKEGCLPCLPCLRTWGMYECIITGGIWRGGTEASRIVKASCQVQQLTVHDIWNASDVHEPWGTWDCGETGGMHSDISGRWEGEMPCTTCGAWVHGLS